MQIHANTVTTEVHVPNTGSLAPLLAVSQGGFFDFLEAILLRANILYGLEQVRQC